MIQQFFYALVWNFLSNGGNTFPNFSFRSSKVRFSATITAYHTPHFFQFYLICNNYQVLDGIVYVADFFSRQHKKNNNNTALLISTVPFVLSAKP
jgi:hypothetical protein